MRIKEGKILFEFIDLELELKLLDDVSEYLLNNRNGVRWQNWYDGCWLDHGNWYLY